MYINDCRLPRSILRLLGSLAVFALVGACGGGGDSQEAVAAEELDDIDRVDALRLRKPVVINSHGPNVVSKWRDVAAATTAVPSSPTGATLEERVAGPD